MQEKPINTIWNRIETFIQDNREALDVDRPSEELWDRIYGELQEEAQPRKLWWQNPAILRVAAAIALLATLSYLWYVRLSDGQTDAAMATLGQTTQTQHKEMLPSSWQEVETAYQAPIDSMMQLPGAGSAGGLGKVNAQLDSLIQAGPPSQARLEAYEGLQRQKVEMLREATQ